MSTATAPPPLPTDPIPLTNGLTLTPRIKFNLTIFPSSPSPPPLNEWNLKHSLLTFLKSSLSLPSPIPVSDDDLVVRRYRDTKKRKREDPVARGWLVVRELGFVGERGVGEWRKLIVEKMDGMDVNLEGVRFRVRVEVPKGEEFEGMRKGWEEDIVIRSENSRGYARSGKREPDTLILRGLPSRWFAETLVSSKPSMLVTHTIISTLGKIRNLRVEVDDDIGKDTDEENADIVSGLHCKIVVQFEKYKDFCNAVRALCGRSLQKEGSRLKADYEVTYEKDGFFQSSNSNTQDNRGRIPAPEAVQYGSKPARWQMGVSRWSPDNTQQKRYKDPPCVIQEGRVTCFFEHERRCQITGIRVLEARDNRVRIRLSDYAAKSVEVG
ncbi:hypothetical protein AKJ16_DCAP20115 [Drosera capensis]